MSLYESIKGKVIKEEKIEEISAQTKYNAAKKAAQDAESERGKSDDLFRTKRRQQAMTAAVHINPAIESEARKIADMLTQSTGAAGFRASIDKLRDDNGLYVELEFINRGNIDDNIIFKIKKDGVKVINQDRIPKELERKLAVFVDKIRKAELDINTDDSTGSMNESSTSSNPEIEKLEKELFDALNDPKIIALIQKGIANMKPEDKEKLAKVTMSEGEGGDFSSFKSMVDKFVDKVPMKEFGTEYKVSDLESSEDESKSELSKAAGTIIKNAGTANIMSMGFLPAILAIVTDYIGGTHIVDSVAKAVGDGSAAAVLSVAGGLIGGAVLWKIGSMLKGEKVTDDTPLFESLLKLIMEKKKPSEGLTKKEKSAISTKAKAGKDIGKKGKGFEKVAAKAAKEYGSKEAGKRVAAAQMWKAQAGKKK